MSTYLCADVVNHNALVHFLENSKATFTKTFDGSPLPCIHGSSISMTSLNSDRSEEIVFDITGHSRVELVSLAWA